MKKMLMLTNDSEDNILRSCMREWLNINKNIFDDPRRQQLIQSLPRVSKVTGEAKAWESYMTDRRYVQNLILGPGASFDFEDVQNVIDILGQMLSELRKKATDSRHKKPGNIESGDPDPGEKYWLQQIAIGDAVYDIWKTRIITCFNDDDFPGSGL